MVLSELDAQAPPAPWRGTRGRRITDEQLRLVAEIYRRAVDEHKAPLLEIAKHLKIARSTAARLVMQAREAGYLGPARRGVAGER
jgi:DNA-binding MarR family transcriptional regulator